MFTVAPRPLVAAALLALVACSTSTVVYIGAEADGGGVHGALTPDAGDDGDGGISPTSGRDAGGEDVLDPADAPADVVVTATLAGSLFGESFPTPHAVGVLTPGYSLVGEELVIAIRSTQPVCGFAPQPMDSWMVVAAFAGTDGGIEPGAYPIGHGTSPAIPWGDVSWLQRSACANGSTTLTTLFPVVSQGIAQETGSITITAFDGGSVQGSFTVTGGDAGELTGTFDTTTLCPSDVTPWDASCP